MHLSKFEKQFFTQMPPAPLPGNGKPQRSKIPRTTQAKRLHAKSGKLMPMKKWAKESDEQIAADWRAAK